MSNTLSQKQLESLATKIKTWGIELGFQQIGITDTDLSVYNENANTEVQENESLQDNEIRIEVNHPPLTPKPPPTSPPTARRPGGH